MNLVHPHHTIDDALVVRRQDLHAAGPVDLHGIVAGWIVAGRHHDPAGAVRHPHRKRELGRAAVTAEKGDPEARCQQHLGTELGKVLRAMPGVVGNRTGRGLIRWQDTLDVIGESLGALADRPVVDRVGAHRKHPAATAAGAEWDHRPEDVVEFLPLPGVDPSREFGGKLGVTRFSKPGPHRGGGVVGDRAGGVGSSKGSEAAGQIGIGRGGHG